MLLDEILRNRAQQNPQKVALVCEGQRLTYKEIDERADRLATALICSGVRRGDRVGIHLGNSAEAVIGLFAVVRAGGVFVLINQSVRPEKLVFMLDYCQARALLLGDRCSSQSSLKEQVPSLQAIMTVGRLGGGARELLDGLEFDQLESAFPSIRPQGCSKVGRAGLQTCDTADLEVCATTLNGDFPLIRPAAAGIDLDLACLIYTSGSTGKPKAVMCDHSSMLFAIDSINSYLKHTAEDIVLSVLPLAFSYGLYQLLTVFRAGGTLILEKSFAYPAVVVRKMAAERVTGFPAVPTMCSLLAQMDLESCGLSNLRYITNAAAAVPPNVLLELRRKLPRTQIFSMHGLTEVVRTVYLNPNLVENYPASVGKAIPGVEVWLEDNEGRRLGPGQTGELVVRGRNVMRGYWADPEGTAERFRPGVLPGERLCYSGDLFRSDAEGNLYFVGRKDDIIKCRGEKVSPREIENVLWAMEGVIEAAVVGVPDPVLGQAIKAVLVCKNNQLSTAQVLSYCRAHLEEHMIPRYVEFLPELPKTASGKILKSNLVEPCAA